MGVVEGFPNVGADFWLGGSAVYRSFLVVCERACMSEVEESENSCEERVHFECCVAAVSECVEVVWNKC